MLHIYDREYPFAWLGILAQAAPTTDELIYSRHERGFSLYSMRSPEITRLYLQVAPDEDLAKWSDDRIWSELATRLPTADGFKLLDGPILERGITGMRSFVVAPMRYGRLVLAGDAAHIVPPTGAKGMNLAVADVSVLAEAIDVLERTGDESLLEAYSATCLQRVWRVQHFSWWMTSMLHRFGHHDDFQQPAPALRGDVRGQLAGGVHRAGRELRRPALRQALPRQGLAEEVFRAFVSRRSARAPSGCLRCR